MTETIPDPELSLSETVNTMGELILAIQRKHGDAVLESALEKLRGSAQVYAHHNPEEMDALMGEIEMQKRFENR